MARCGGDCAAQELKDNMQSDTSVILAWLLRASSEIFAWKFVSFARSQLRDCCQACADRNQPLRLTVDACTGCIQGIGYDVLPLLTCVQLRDEDAVQMTTDV